MKYLDPTIMPIHEQPLAEGPRSATTEPGAYWVITLFVFCIWILFVNLGVVALFEPDEGRNAEIAREILLLKDWVTPHYDFIPRLDKPMLFFNLIAFSYKLFGVSEWSARLPSALAALGCIALIYYFSRALFGRWAALWSGLVLITSPEFFALSRVVILEMTLTLFMTIALCGFVLGQRAVGRRKKRALFLLMYPAMGVATLVKGPVGFLLPAMVIFAYLLLSRSWKLIREMELPLGIPLFLLTAAPWYVLTELRNPGYLNYFLWDENVSRFATTRFHRSGAWYYFIGILAAGFFPWTVLLPNAIADLWKRRAEEKRLFLILWAALPLLFFSLSSSKLPHYILFVYPPVAAIVGAAIANLLGQSSAKPPLVLSFSSGVFVLLALITTLMTLWPAFLPHPIRSYVYDTFPQIIFPFVGSAILTFLGVLAVKRGLWTRRIFLYAATGVGFATFILVATPIVTKISLDRSSKQLAEKVSSFIGADDQLILYGGYPSSLPFYLNIQRPMWVVWSGRKGKQVLGSDYVAARQPEPAAGYGQILFTGEEFAELWKTSKNRFLIFVDGGALNRFGILIGTQPRILFEFGDTVLIENRGTDRN